MSSIIRRGETFRGIRVESRGVFTHATKFGYVRTYAGQIRDGHACGLGVLTWYNGKYYAEHGPDGQYDGRCLWRYAIGDTVCGLWERGGKAKESARVYANGRCTYNGVACAPDDPRVLALIAQVAPVEVHPPAPAHLLPLAARSPPSHRPMDRPARFAPAGAGGRRGHRGAPPRRTPSLVVARHTTTAAALQSANLTVARTWAFLRYWSHGRHPLAP